MNNPAESAEGDRLVNEIIASFLEAEAAGQHPDRAELLARHPDLAEELRAFFADHDGMRHMARPAASPAECETLAPNQTAAAAPGMRLSYFGDYELLEEIARGGMGVVYRARQVSLNRTVALKMILSGQLASLEDVRRFHLEAEAAANLDHPHIVPIYEVGEHEAQHYFSMKLVEGGSLASRQPSLPARQAAELLATVARAVHHAHQRGILHRDLKPGNILIDAQGQPYVTDFGLAKRVEGDQQHTRTGGILGTPSYMPPEQARSEKVLTTAVDVYSLGAILYEMLTGRPPFQAATALDTILQVLDREPQRPSRIDHRIDADLETICLMCLEKDPNRRYGSAEALADDLDRWRRGESIRARAAGKLERAAKWAKRRPTAAALVAVSVVALFAVVGLFIGFTIQVKSERDAARAAFSAARAAREREREQLRKQEEALERTKRALTTSKIAQANVALRDHDPKLGLALLESCPPETRFWEWDYTRRLCLGAPLTLHPDIEFFNAVFSPDGLWIAATNAGETSLLDARTGAEKWRVRAGFRPATFSPDSRRVAAWDRNFNQLKKVWEMGLKVWDVPTGKEVLTIPARMEGSGGPIVFSADGRWLACAGIDNTTTAWDARTRKQQFAIPLKNANLFYNTGYNGAVQLAYTPGGSLAVYDGEEVRFLDPLTGKEQRKVSAKGFDADFSPDVRCLALRTEAATIRVLDLDTKAQLWESPIEYGHLGAVLKYSPDGERLAFMFGGQGQGWAMENIRLLDAATGKLVGTLPNKHWGDHPYSLSFSGDGQRLAVCHRNAVEVWNVRDLTDGATLRGHTDTILDQVFSPDHRQLLTVANTGAAAGSPAWEVKRWNVDGGFAISTTSGHAAPLSCAAFNGKADRVAVGGSDNTVRICDTEGRELLLVGLEGSPTELAFDPGNDFLAVLVQENDVSRILILDAASGRERQVIAPRKHLEALALSPDGKSVAGAVLVRTPPKAQNPDTVLPATLERIQVWSVETGREEWRVELPPNRVVTKPVLAFSPNGRWLAGNTTDWTVTLWETQTQAEHLQVKIPADADSRFGPGPNGIRSLAFSADSERLATGGDMVSGKVWDTRTGQEVYSFMSPRVSFWEWGGSRLAFRADNLALAYARGKTVSLLSAETVPSRTYLEGSSTLAVFSPDKRLVAASGPEDEILLFDALTGQRVKRLEGHTQPIAALVFSADDKRLLSASLRDDVSMQGRRMPLDMGIDVKEVKVWDLETGKPLALFGNLERKVSGLVLSADGSRVAARLTRHYITKQFGPGLDEIYVWDVPTRQRLRSFSCEDSSYDLAFAQDGKVVAIRSQTGKVVAWSVETGDPAKVDGDPFQPERDKRAEGRRLWFANGKSFIQPEPDERQRERLRDQGRPDPAWHAEKARSAEADKQWFAAGFHLGRLLLENPRDASLLCRRARTYINQKRWNEARTDCNQAVRLQPKSVEAWVTRGLLEYRQGRTEQAHADLASAALMAPDEPAVDAWQCFLYLVDKQEEKAAAAEKRLLKQFPILLGVTGIRADVAYRDPKPLRQPSPVWNLLEEELTQRLAEDAKSVPLLRLRGAVRLAQGRATGFADGWLGAHSDFQKATTQAPTDVLAWKSLACVIWQGQWRHFGGAPKEGLDACDVILGVDPKAWEFWYLRGLFCALDRQPALALKAYTRALEMRADFVPALRERGAAHAELGQWAEAVADLARAAELTGPADPELWDLLALAELGRGDSAAYTKTCARMLEMFGSPPPLIWAGGAFAAGPLNLYGAPLALHVANQNVRLNRQGADVTAVRWTSRPDTRTDWQRLIALTRHSAAEVRGKVFCRAGRYDEAVKLLEPLRIKPVEAEASREGAFGLSGRPPTLPTSLLTLYLSLAEHGRGSTKEAKQLLKEATDWLDKPAQDNPKQKNRDNLQWTQRVQIDQLRRELEGLLEDKAP